MNRFHANKLTTLKYFPKSVRHLLCDNQWGNHNIALIS